MGCQHARRPWSSTSSISSISSRASHHEPSPGMSPPQQPLRFFTYTNTHTTTPPSSRTLSCEGMSTHETRELWCCMLELQQRYGCYNSTRIDLAVNAGEAGIELMPNRFIIDTLNDSLVDLPHEGWDMLDRCLRHKPSQAWHPETKSTTQSRWTAS